MKRAGRTWWVVGGLCLVALAATFLLSGIALVPTAVTLGPCLPNLVRTSAYRLRESPLATVEIPLASGHARLCYGRPSARGRVVFGALVPDGEPWRLGANEPTRLYVDHAISLAGLDLEPGRYSLWAVPGPERWSFHVSRSTTHWGNDISASARTREVGSVEVPRHPILIPVETLTVATEMRGDSTLVHFDWAVTRVTIPLVPVGGSSRE